MGAKVAALLLTFTLSIAFGMAVMVFLLVAMNGYSESDAMWGLGVYGGLAFIIAMVCGVIAYIFTGSLIKKGSGALRASLTAIPVFTIVAIVLELIAALIGVGTAELVRVNF